MGEKLTFVNFMKKNYRWVGEDNFQARCNENVVVILVQMHGCSGRMGKRLLDYRRLDWVLSFLAFNNTLICEKNTFGVH